MKVVGFSEPASYREMAQKNSTVRFFALYALTFYIIKIYVRRLLSPCLAPLV